MGGGGRHSDSSYSNIGNFTTNNAGGGAGAGGAGGVDECAKLTISTELQNIDRHALREVEPGDVLEIRINSVTKAPEVLNKHGVRCGNIVSNKSSQMRKCIEAGNVFKATVEDVRGDQCQVTVQKA